MPQHTKLFSYMLFYKILKNTVGFVLLFNKYGDAGSKMSLFAQGHIDNECIELEFECRSE